MVDRVFFVTHTHELSGGEEDEKLIGVYSSTENADAAVVRASGLPGFREHPDGFHVDAYAVDVDHWTEGFVTTMTE
jgi:homoserine kinase type II